MKRFLPYILILFILVGVFTPTNFAHAGTVADFINIGIAGVAGVESIAVILFHSIFVSILFFMSWVLWLSGQILNYVLDFTIIKMSANLKDLTGINIAWKLIRDLMNIAFIFMLVYEGILLIIGQGSTNNIKKFITNLVIASLLINFSLFFTKVMIDASNIVTIGFYNNILGNGAAQAGYGLSNPIVRHLGLPTTYSEKGDPSFGGGSLGGIFVAGFGSGAILLIASFVFFAISILFTIRYLVLLVLLMLSPVAYLGTALPFLGTYSKDWWNAFKNQLLFAPIFMVMMWVILLLMKSPGFIDNASTATFAQIISGAKVDASNMNLIFNYVVIIGLLITALVTAKQTAAKGSKMIGDATGRLSTFAGGVVAGGTARLSRNTVGRWGNATANDQELADRVAKGTATRGERLKFAAANKAATSSFDVRASRPFGAIAGAANMSKDFGKVDSKKENFRAQMEERDKAETKRAEMYKPSDLAVQQAKDRLKSSEFEEAERKAKEEYFKSAAYKNSAFGKMEALNIKTKDDYSRIEASSKILVQEQVDLKDKLAKQIKLDETMGGGFSQIQRELSDQLTAKNKEVEDTVKNLNKLEKLMNVNKIHQEGVDNIKKSWMSQERKRLIATSGGTTWDKQKKAQVDANKNMVPEEITSAYEERLKAVANREEAKNDRNVILRWSANVIGGATNAVGLTSAPRTKTDRQVLAMKLRKQAKGKSAKDKIADAVKEMQDAEKDVEEVAAPEKAPVPDTPPAPDAGGAPTT